MGVAIGAGPGLANQAINADLTTAAVNEDTAPTKQLFIVTPIARSSSGL